MTKNSAGLQRNKARKSSAFITKMDHRETNVRRMDNCNLQALIDQGATVDAAGYVDIESVPVTRIKVTKNWSVTEFRIDHLLKDLLQHIKDGMEFPEWKEKLLLRWIDVNTKLAQVIGLERKSKDVETLQSYLAKKQQQRESQ